MNSRSALFCILFTLPLGCSDGGSTSEPPADGGLGENSGTGGNVAAAGSTSGAGGFVGAGGGAPITGPGGATAAGGGAGVNPSAAGGAPTRPGAGGDPAAGGARGTGGANDPGAGGASSAGGAGAGGATACDWSEPPADVAAWVDESWDAQLGGNIRGRQAWNLDNVMLNGGSMNLCVRWGATSPVPESVRTQLAPTIARWFNDWFEGLGGYGCFPYGGGIQVKVTGWAVRPGQESLLGAVGPGVPVYTETDRDGEPKCPDACSSFVHWDHQFPGCAGGDANHSDYWLWFDDTLPGGGGAAAVGGDWGLRMPVSTFLGAFENASFGIAEHEMGHGFGIQDYYDWTGSRPAGGSIMIVGSARSQAPTTADIWLLRRTWKEMKELRGW